MPVDFFQSFTAVLCRQNLLYLWLDTAIALHLIRCGIGRQDVFFEEGNGPSPLYMVKNGMHQVLQQVETYY